VKVKASGLAWLLAFAVAGVVLYVRYESVSSASLPYSTNPPAFSVTYLMGPGSGAGTTGLASNLRQSIESDLSAIKDVGFQGVKLVFSFRNNNIDVRWTAKSAARLGLYPIGLLAGHNAKIAGQPFSAEELAEWERFVRDQVKSTKGYVYFWEVWNEPDIDIFRYGSPEAYVELLKVTYSAIKEENPQAKVVMAIGAADRNGLEFLRRVLDAGGGRLVDILGVHPYAANPYIQPEVFEQSLSAVRTLIREYGDKWPMWVTEIGQPVSEVSDQRRAELAEYVFRRTREEGIPVTWYYFSDKPLAGTSYSAFGWGLVRSDGTPTPALQAIQEFIKSAGRQ